MSLLNPASTDRADTPANDQHSGTVAGSALEIGLAADSLAGSTGSFPPKLIAAAQLSEPSGGGSFLKCLFCGGPMSSKPNGGPPRKFCCKPHGDLYRKAERSRPDRPVAARGPASSGPYLSNPERDAKAYGTERYDAPGRLALVGPLRRMSPTFATHVATQSSAGQAVA